MLVGQPDGRVMITRAGTKRHAGALVVGQSPVERMGVTIATDNKFGKVAVRGQRRVGTGKDALRQEHVDQDGDSLRSLLVIAEGDHTNADLQTRAKWERLRLAGYGIRPRANVSTWRDAGGVIWDPGRLVAIQNDVEQVFGDFTLSSASLSLTDGSGSGAGTAARLEFVDPRAHGGKAGAGKSDAVFSPGGGL